MEQHIESVEATEMEKYSAQYSSFGGEYVFSRVTKTAQFEEFSKLPMRVGTLTMVLCLRGEFDIKINLDEYKVHTNQLLVFGSECVIHLTSIDWDNLDAYVIAITPKFLRDINFEVNVLTTINLSPNQHPLLSLGAEDVELMSRYFDLLHYNTVANSDVRCVRNIARALVYAAVNQLMQFIMRHKPLERSAAVSRRAKYIQDFMELLAQNYNRERTVAYYAGRLCISPKYLSLILKESTGRSAAEWIDDYVINEAKNLLKFSGKNIQQIAYALNFSNQSSFGKYFKHLTGMSPTKFQRR